MPPKQRIVVQPSRRAGNQNRGFFSNIYQQLTTSENASMVRSVAIFGGAVAFLHSSLGEYLIPEL